MYRFQSTHILHAVEFDCDSTSYNWQKVHAPVALAGKAIVEHAVRHDQISGYGADMSFPLTRGEERYFLAELSKVCTHCNGTERYPDTGERCEGCSRDGEFFSNFAREYWREVGYVSVLHVRY